MDREIANENDFDAQLKNLGELYEGGKGIVNSNIGVLSHDDYANLIHTLQEMRDMCAVQLQQKHWIDPN